MCRNGLGWGVEKAGSLISSGLGSGERTGRKRLSSRDESMRRGVSRRWARDFLSIELRGGFLGFVFLVMGGVRGGW